MPLTKIPHLLILPATSISATSTSGYSSSVDLTAAVQLLIEAGVTYNANATDPCVVEIYAAISNGSFSTIPFASITIPVNKNNPVQIDVPINCAANYIKALIRNTDASNGITNGFISVLVQEAS
jgi:hypothetical protein